MELVPFWVGPTVCWIRPQLFILSSLTGCDVLQIQSCSRHTFCVQHANACNVLLKNGAHRFTLAQTLAKQTPSASKGAGRGGCLGTVQRRPKDMMTQSSPKSSFWVSSHAPNIIVPTTCIFLYEGIIFLRTIQDPHFNDECSLKIVRRTGNKL